MIACELKFIQEREISGDLETTFTEHTMKLNSNARKSPLWHLHNQDMNDQTIEAATETKPALDPDNP